MGLIAAALLAVVIFLRFCGLLHPYSVPTGAMTPAISAGNHVMMEGFTYLVRNPRRGDVVVFKTDGITALPPAKIYVKRIAGEPGDHLRIDDGKFYVNGKQVTLSNAAGAIAYLPAASMSTNPSLTVPAGNYFILGDNTAMSYDSRFWGCVPRENIIGRISFCYWPTKSVGVVK